MKHESVLEGNRIGTALKNLLAHDHLCLLYKTKEQWSEAIFPFLCHGIEKGEKIVYIADTTSVDEMHALLAERGVNWERLERKGQLEILREYEAYTSGGTFDPDKMISLLQETTEKALKEGYPALRVTGEMTWVLRGKPGSERLTEYESKLNRDFFPKYPCIAICQYDVGKFDSKVIKEVIKTHPLLVYEGRVFNNYYYIPTDIYLSPLQNGAEVDIWLRNLNTDFEMRIKLQEEAEALKASESKYRHLVEHQTEFICEYTPDFVLTFTNLAYAKALGVMPDEIVGKKWVNFIPEVERNRLMSAILRLSPSNDVIMLENSLIRYDGKVLWTEWVDKGLFDNEGNLQLIQAVGRDITEKKKVYEELEATKQQLMDIIEFLPDATMAVNSEGHVIAWNQAMEELSGIKKDEMLGKGDYAYAVPFYGYPRLVLLNVILENDEALLEKYVRHSKKGRLLEAEARVGDRWLWAIAAPLLNSKKEVVGAIESVRDITTQRKMEEERSRYSKDLEEKIEQKTRQLEDAQQLAILGKAMQMIGHDLRNPLQAMINEIGYAQKVYLKSQNPFVAQMQDSFFFMIKQIEYMDKIVSDLQDFARPIKLERVRLELKPFIEEVIKTFDDNNKNTFEVMVAPDLALSADAHFIKRALVNLINNGIQAMPNGGKITISATANEGKVLITITDTGIGISRENIVNLFRPFFTTKAKGQGLGLAVAKRAIEAHNGRIWAESEEGKGTTFFVELPLS